MNECETLIREWQNAIKSLLPLAVHYTSNCLHSAQWTKVEWDPDIDSDTTQGSKTAWRMELAFEINGQKFTQTTLSQHWSQQKTKKKSGTTPYHHIFVSKHLSLNELLPWRERYMPTTWKSRAQNLRECLQRVAEIQLRCNSPLPPPPPKKRQREEFAQEEIKTPKREKPKEKRACETCYRFGDCKLFCALCGNHGCIFCQGRICAHCQPYGRRERCSCRVMNDADEFMRMMNYLRGKTNEDKKRKEKEDEERRKLFKQLALRLHPDKFPGKKVQWLELQQLNDKEDLQGMKRFEQTL